MDNDILEIDPHEIVTVIVPARVVRSASARLREAAAMIRASATGDFGRAFADDLDATERDLTGVLDNE